MSDGKGQPGMRLWVGMRFLVVFLVLLLLAVVFYLIGGTSSGAGFAGGFSTLFILPFTVGGILRLALGSGTGDRPEQPPKRSGWKSSLSLITTLAIMVLVGVVVREGVICLVMLASPWGISGLLGVTTVGSLQAAFRRRARLHSAGLMALPFLVLLAGPVLPHATHHFEVRRSIIIEAPADRIWPHLLALENLSDEEGEWTIAQNLLRIPRPRSAVVVGEGEGARRLAQWGDHITFEEHVTHWRPEQRLSWRFVFPNDSVGRYTDAHIGPDSDYLGVETGGYELTPVGDGRTRLTLHTRYRASSPANHYSALWGEVILGGIQSNILHIIADRAEAENAANAM